MKKFEDIFNKNKIRPIFAPTPPNPNPICFINIIKNILYL